MLRAQSRSLFLIVAFSLFIGIHSVSDAAEPGRVVVWSRADGSLPVLRAAAARFAKRTGIPVDINTPTSMLDKFQILAESSQGPDAILWAHDRSGEWARAGLISDVEPKARFRQSLQEIGWQAFRYDKRFWGYPLALESAALLINRDLLSEAPTRFEDIAALEGQLAKRNIKALLWDYTNAYYSWPLLSAGLHDKEDFSAALQHATVRANVHWLNGMLRKGVLPPGSDYTDMELGFNRGEVAMIITGPWAWDNLRRSKIDFEVHPLPALNGKPCRPFVGVVGLMLAARSPNKQLAIKFIEEELYAAETQSALFAYGAMRGVPADKATVRRLFADPLLRRQLQVIRGGQLMPNTPDMGAFWSTVGSALFNIGLGRQTVDEALDKAARRLSRP